MNYLINIENTLAQTGIYLIILKMDYSSAVILQALLFRIRESACIAQNRILRARITLNITESLPTRVSFLAVEYFHQARHPWRVV